MVSRRGYLFLLKKGRTCARNLLRDKTGRRLVGPARVVHTPRLGRFTAGLGRDLEAQRPTTLERTKKWIHCYPALHSIGTWSASLVEQSVFAYNPLVLIEPAGDADARVRARIFFTMFTHKRMPQNKEPRQFSVGLWLLSSLEPRVAG